MSFREISSRESSKCSTKKGRLITPPYISNISEMTAGLLGQCKITVAQILPNKPGPRTSLFESAD
ncbi:hypothetical protein CLF_103280 [Clonorchis sinensis]|uniref:Uncharacterized protein n=1 Tax=Clonorchis sinensis TaxID=79923 RepID=G7Y9G7_CLOSI|nr:hypothetical protein CLF_103280 [Clonorchis sinensis]